MGKFKKFLRENYESRQEIASLALHIIKELYNMNDDKFKPAMRVFKLYNDSIFYFDDFLKDYKVSNVKFANFISYIKNGIFKII